MRRACRLPQVFGPCRRECRDSIGIRSVEHAGEQRAEILALHGFAAVSESAPIVRPWKQP